PSRGIPTVPNVANRTTKDTPGTPAIPLEVIISTMTNVTCSIILKSIPYICAINIAANDWYNVEPSKLKEYPVGITKETMSFGQPLFSNFSINLGNTVSELDVE